MSFSVEHWFVYIAIALTCGILGQVLVRRSPGGYELTTAAGLFGAFLGAYIATALGAQERIEVTTGAMVIPILWPIVGAIAAVAVRLAVFPPRRARARA
jgi:uncharacterized membrane protein YeaQ/YmgE (transglycosylase-associated protein family)